MLVIACAAVAVVFCTMYGALPKANMPQADAASSLIVPASSGSVAESALNPTPVPTATPVPTPEPLGIVKNESLPFSMLAPTTAMSFEELVGDNGVYEDESEIPPLPPAGTYKIVIDIYHQFATVYKKDNNGEYTIPVRYVVVSSGSGKHPTPRGTFKMGDSYVRFGKFVTYGVYGQYWRQITGAIFCHSLIYSSRNANSYTSSYSSLGSRVSHGCVRMMVPDARWIYYNIAPDTECDIISGDKSDEASAQIKAQLVYPERPESRPGLNAGQIPVTEAWPGWQGNAYSQYLAFIESETTTDETSSIE